MTSRGKTVRKLLCCTYATELRYAVNNRNQDMFASSNSGPCRTEFSDVGFDFIVVGTNKI